MIIVLFGQPHSGKSTIANELLKQNPNYINVDGDQLRELFVNKDFSREGRIKNLNRASDIAHFINSTGKTVILSLVYPYKEARDYLNSLTKDVKWIYLTYSGVRGRENFHVTNFENPIDENFLHIHTSLVSLDNSIKLINLYTYAKSFSESTE